MNILNIIKSLGNRSKNVNTNELPSMGLFYPDDLKIYINKCSNEDIAIYEKNLNPNNILAVGSCIKLIIDKCVWVSGKYTVDSIKSIDMLFLLLEIVKFTKNKEVYINYYNDQVGKDDVIAISSKTFNYLDTSDLIQYYRSDTKEFVISGYRYSIPSKGVEKSITEYLSSDITESHIKKLDSYSFDFIYFLGNRDFISFSEIDNLIEIFNEDMDETLRVTVSSVVEKFKPLLTYSLIKDNRIIDFRNKLNLESIWK